MSLDPSSMTVKEAKAALDGLSDDELSEAYEAELEGKGRRSLLDEIKARRDDLREVAPAPAPAPKKAKAAARSASKVEVVTRPARPGAAAASYVKIVVE
jgi:hypothetical protein